MAGPVRRCTRSRPARRRASGAPRTSPGRTPRAPPGAAVASGQVEARLPPPAPGAHRGHPSPATLTARRPQPGLVQHLRECFAGYGEVELTGGPAAGRRTAAAGPRLLVEVQGEGDGGGGHETWAGEGRVLVLCTCDGEVTAGPPTRTRSGRPVDVVEVRRASEIAGAVAEATAGDLPLVVDVRLSRADAEALLRTPGDPAPRGR